MTGVWRSDTFLSPPPRCPIVFKPSPDLENVRWGVPLKRPLTRPRGAKKAGILYERKVQDVLMAIYAAAYEPSPVIQYTLRGVRKAAIPDGILRIGDTLWIIEVKLAHTVRVWEQLMDRYVPLVRALEPQRRIRAVEVCRSYDPAVILPGPHALTTSLHRSAPRSGRGGDHSLEVLTWRI
jgi:hypothetical protein